MMPRIFVEFDVVIGKIITVSGPEGHHFARVLRANRGEELVIAAGNGPHLGKIEQVDQETGRLDITVVNSYEPHEPVHKITVIQGLAKGEKMDTIIQKCTEVGASRIICYQAKRSIVSLKAKVDQKIERWQRIAREAAGQAQRDIVPSISFANSIAALTSLIEREQVDLFILLDEAERKTGFQHVLTRPGQKRVAIAVGPEGGWDDDERQMLHTLSGGVSVTLGPLILRTETAGVVATAVVLHHLSQLGV
jgi:16S rRNA (uracil1498-N3)-methyltransferase